MLFAVQLMIHPDEILDNDILFKKALGAQYLARFCAVSSSSCTTGISGSAKGEFQSSGQMLLLARLRASRTSFSYSSFEIQTGMYE